MNEIFIKSLYETIIKDKELYRDQLEHSNIDKVEEEYLKQVLEIYNNASEEKKDALIDFIGLVITDTVSDMLGIIDGSSTLNGCDAEPKLYLDDVDTDGELQDLFLEYIEEMEEQIVNLTLNNLDNVVKEGKNGSINCVYYVYTLGF